MRLKDFQNCSARETLVLPPHGALASSAAQRQECAIQLVRKKIAMPVSEIMISAANMRGICSR